MTYYWALVGKKNGSFERACHAAASYFFRLLSVTCYKLSFAYCTCCPGCRGKNLKKSLFFTLKHFNDIKMQKSEKSDFLGSGYPTDLYPSYPTFEIILVILHIYILYNIVYVTCIWIYCIIYIGCWFLTSCFIHFGGNISVIWFRCMLRIPTGLYKLHQWFM